MSSPKKPGTWKSSAVAQIACILLVMPTACSAEDPTSQVAFPGLATEVQPVLQLSFVETAAGDRTNTTTAVAVYPDGTVVVPDGADDTAPRRGHINGESLEKLLHDVVQTHRLLECVSGDIEQALIRESQRSGLAWRVPGAATTVIQVRWQGHDHEVRCPAATLLEIRFPGIAELHRVCAVQRRLQNVKCIVQAGGVDAAKRLAGLANRELGAEHGLSVSIDDLQLVRSSGDGLCYAQFLVAGDGVVGNVTLRLVSVIETPGAAPQVSVMQVPPSRP